MTNRIAKESGIDKTTGYNSSYKKLAVQWLNEVLCFVSSSVVVDSFRLRNRQLLVAANRQVVKKLRILKNTTHHFTYKAHI